jgi:hypothetical protein
VNFVAHGQGGDQAADQVSDWADDWANYWVDDRAADDRAADRVDDRAAADRADLPIAPATDHALPQGSEFSVAPIIEDASLYHTCRIKLPNQEKRLFAIVFQDQYYRLVRTRKSQDKAVQMAERLRDQGYTVLITRNDLSYPDASYTVWMLEAQAVPCQA